MKICGLITEYNPFHHGHLHHMQEARRITGCDYLVVVMSGNFVQRGTPAIIDKYDRTDQALQAGADLILELPVLFSTASAEAFATAGISLLNQLGCVDSVVFGSELGELEPLRKIAEVLNDEPEAFRKELRDGLKSGLSFPAARASALEACFNDSLFNVREIMESPNNILGVEYLRALKKLKCTMTPYAIPRWKTAHNDITSVFKDVASATSLRNMLYEEDAIEKITPFVTPYTAREFALKLGVSTPVRADDFSLLLQYRLMSERSHLTDYLDFSKELQDRVNHLLPDCYTFKEWAVCLKTKAYTHTRINRALLHLILNMKEADLKAYAEEDYCMYARILGFLKASAPLLSEIRRNSNLPMISKMADTGSILSEKALRLLQLDIHAADIYRNAVYQKFGTVLKDEYTAGIIIR